MEPGHEDREDENLAEDMEHTDGPQWSPVTKTGKTRPAAQKEHRMAEPQWSPVTKTGKTADLDVARKFHGDAAMEPGHEDREDPSPQSSVTPCGTRRNGARSRRPGRPAEPDFTKISLY